MESAKASPTSGAIDVADRGRLPSRAGAADEPPAAGADPGVGAADGTGVDGTGVGAAAAAGAGAAAVGGKVAADGIGVPGFRGFSFCSGLPKIICASP